ncbi:hypothetical protein [Nonomuraea ceibae]|uniref:hypothetical protein n=1 Tax=Nonomuraea ceibae TaxID=1935170 RepID=UPI001C5D196E|nr:hypothetical protein [Nonomuraea ceibae]
MQPVKSVGRFLPTLFLICIVFYIFTDPQGAAVAFKWAFQTATAGVQHFAEFIRAVAA